jgi:carbon starvation protein
MLKKIVGSCWRPSGPSHRGHALHRHEPINAQGIVTAAVCVYLFGYRVWRLDHNPVLSRPTRHQERLTTAATPCPASGDRSVISPAIAGPDPGRTDARHSSATCPALWILAGPVFGVFVQHMTILLLSTRRDGRSLGQMARDELGPLGGVAALIGTLLIMVILSAVLGLVIVNVMKHTPWATATVLATIPAAIIVGVYLRI